MAARKLVIFQKIEIEAISLPAFATKFLKVPDYVPSLIATLSRINGSGTVPRILINYTRLERKVGISPALA